MLKNIKIISEMFVCITEMLYICSVLLILMVKNIAHNDDFKQKF